jgi:hypothetical protein
MVTTLHQVQGVADAYRSALAEGDRRFGRNSLENRMLLAVIVESAASTTDWIRTRVSDGTRLAEPLREFLDPARNADVVGRAVATSQEMLLKELKATVRSLARKGTVPSWILTVMAIIGGAFGFAHLVGVSVGAGLFGLVTSGIFLYVLMHAGQSGVIQGLGKVGTEAIATPGAALSLGQSAQSVYETKAKPALASLYASENATIIEPTVLKKLRVAAVPIIAVAWICAAVAVIFFVAGMIEGFSEAASSRFPTSTPFPQ